MFLSLTGPSGVGKGYLKQKILGVYPVFSELLWLTTRSLRPDEIGTRTNRKSVSFDELSILRARGMIAHEQFLFENWYALTVEEIERTRTQDCMTETHIRMFSQMKAAAPHMVAIALIPKSVDLLRERLLVGRGAAPGPDTSLRLGAAANEIHEIRRRSHDFDFVIEVAKEQEPDAERIILDFLSQRLKPSGEHP